MTPMHRNASGARGGEAKYLWGWRLILMGSPAPFGLSSPELDVARVDVGRLSSIQEGIIRGAEPPSARLMRVDGEVVAEAPIGRVVCAAGGHEEGPKSPESWGELVIEADSPLHRSAWSLWRQQELIQQ